jgi:pimeloyl-ACP methyl ester carboxylesterase
VTADEHPDTAGNEVVGIAVPGGALAVELIRSATEPVLAIHGISSQRKLWNWLRTTTPELSLIAPDLRGRGDSIGVSGESSIARHAADMAAVLDHLGIDAVHVCGMSMGGFVAVELATSYPERVHSLILVDGGFPMPAPPGLTPEDMPRTFRDRLARLDREWPSVAAYARFFVATTGSLLDQADPLLLDYLAHDLSGGRVRLSGDALIADSVDVFFGTSSWQQLTVPTRLLAAQWGRGRDAEPAYSAAAVQAFRRRLPALVSVRELAGADHAASIMSPAGASAVAELIAEALPGAGQPRDRMQS